MNPPTTCRARQAGFSLIELLVVTVILGIVIAAVGACLAGGIRVWDAAQRFGRVEADGLMAMETVCRDLRNTFPMMAIGFQGESASLGMPGIVIWNAPDAGVQRRVGAIRYRLEGEELVRETQLLSEEGTLDAMPVKERMMDHAVALTFTYVAADNQAQTVTTNLPVRVDLALTVDDRLDHDPPAVITRSIRLAGGGAP